MTGVLIAMMAFNVALLLHQRWRSWQRRAPRRALERVRTTAIASLQEGDLTKITGVIAPRAPMLRSAVEKQPCIGYSMAVETTEDAGWRPVLNSGECVSFFVRDESGTAVVEGNIVIAPHPECWVADAACIRGVTTTRCCGPPSRAAVAIGRSCCKPGDRVSVLGRARMEIDPAGRSSFRDPPMLNHITGSEDAPVIVAHDMITLS